MRLCGDRPTCVVCTQVKCVRFVGELVKFRLVTAADALHMLRALLDDFAHHHIDM